MNPLKNIFVYSDSVTFESSGNLAHAVNQLSRLASKPMLQAVLATKSSDPSLVGSVSNDRVRLHKVTPFFGNLFKPIFFGEFEADNDRVSLKGQFKMGMMPQIITYIFIIVGAIAQIFALPEIGSRSGIGSLSFLEPSLFICGSLLVVFAGKQLGKKDVPWIKHQLEAALR